MADKCKICDLALGLADGICIHVTPKQKPGPKPGSGRGLTERVQFHGTPGIRARIKAKADAAGVRASEFMRILLGEE